MCDYVGMICCRYGGGSGGRGTGAAIDGGGGGGSGFVDTTFATYTSGGDVRGFASFGFQQADDEKWGQGGNNGQDGNDGHVLIHVF